MTNPFLANSEFKLRVIEMYKTDYTDSAHAMRETTEKFYKEEQKKVTIFKVGNSAGYTNFLFSLSRPGRDLFLYIVGNIGEEKDCITLQCAKVCTAIGISRNTFYSALDDLKNSSVITSFKRSEFWVNPYLIFRGDRIKYYHDHYPGCIDIVARVNTGKSLGEHLRKTKEIQ